MSIKATLDDEVVKREIECESVESPSSSVFEVVQRSLSQRKRQNVRLGHYS